MGIEVVLGAITPADAEPDAQLMGDIEHDVDSGFDLEKIGIHSVGPRYTGYGPALGGTSHDRGIDGIKIAAEVGVVQDDAAIGIAEIIFDGVMHRNIVRGQGVAAYAQPKSVAHLQGAGSAAEQGRSLG